VRSIGDNDDDGDDEIQHLGAPFPDYCGGTPGVAGPTIGADGQSESMTLLPRPTPVTPDSLHDEPWLRRELLVYLAKIGTPVHGFVAALCAAIGGFPPLPPEKFLKVFPQEIHQLSQKGIAHANYEFADFLVELTTHMQESPEALYGIIERVLTTFAKTHEYARYGNGADQRAMREAKKTAYDNPWAVFHGGGGGTSGTPPVPGVTTRYRIGDGVRDPPALTLVRPPPRALPRGSPREAQDPRTDEPTDDEPEPEPDAEEKKLWGQYLLLTNWRRAFDDIMRGDRSTEVLSEADAGHYFGYLMLDETIRGLIEIGTADINTNNRMHGGPGTLTDIKERELMYSPNIRTQFCKYLALLMNGVGGHGPCHGAATRTYGTVIHTGKTRYQLANETYGHREALAFFQRLRRSRMPNGVLALTVDTPAPPMRGTRPARLATSLERWTDTSRSSSAFTAPPGWGQRMFL
jgi:hypothetical protein